MGDYAQNDIFLDLVSIFKGLTDNEARLLAQDLTDSLNNAIALRTRKLHLAHPFLESKISDIIKKIPIQPMSLSIAWRAFSKSRQLSEVELFQQSGLKSILATVPNEYAKKLPVPNQFASPYAGSLVKHLADLINNCQKDLLVVTPYWSRQGVEILKKRIDNNLRKTSKALLLTPANMDDENYVGCQSFKSLLNDLGFDVMHRVPKPMSDGVTPMVHAKVLIADKNLAYVGSANLSQNGLSHSIEVGVSLEGGAAFHLYSWFENISNNFFVNEGSL